MPLIERYPHISSVMVADDRGREHMLLHAAGQWRQRETCRDEWDDEVRWVEWSDADPTPTERRERLEYDPRTRPWFSEALETPDGAIHWTEPYTFFTTREPGITVSVSYDRGDGIERVIGLDVLLKDISEFTRTLEVGRGKVVVLTADRRVLGLPRDPRFDDPEVRAGAYLKRPAELGLRLIEDAAAALHRETEPAAATSRFESGGEAWWGQVKPYTLAPGRLLWLAIVIPERDLIGHLEAQRLAILGILVVVLAIGLLRAVMIARRLSAPVEALVAESDRMSRGDLEPGPPVESNVAEVKRLAEAHAQAREGLRALIRLEKVERDLSLARDIQQGLLPEKPPEVPGFEIAGWNQPTDETGGDYYDWFTLPDDRTVVTLADVTGHGVAPALIAAVCRAYMRATTAFGGMTETLGHVNDLLYHDTPVERFVTLAVALVDPKAQRINLLSAGHGPMLFYEARTGAVSQWQADAPPLGVVKGMEIPEPRRIKVQAGDMLVLITDGFFEWCNESGEAYGTKRLESFVRDHHDLPPQRFIEALHQAVLDHVAGTEQADDLTAVVIRAC
jgi:serine phosphatase RsbU (regulator of sigma subunit)